MVSHVYVSGSSDHVVCDGLLSSFGRSFSNLLLLEAVFSSVLSRVYLALVFKIADKVGT